MVLARPAAALLAAATAGGVERALVQAGVADRDGWTRPNFRDRPVSLIGGASVAAGAVAGALAGAGSARLGAGSARLGSDGFSPSRWRAAVLIAGGSAALAGAYDDLRAPRTEASTDKGWRGHLRAIRSGRISGGVVKVAVIGTGSLLAARLTARTGATTTANAALIAVTANLVNLFDLRPGRADKVTLLAATGLLGGPAGPIVAGVAGAALAGLPADLGETRMLGDLGANTLGALLGLSLTASGPVTRGAALAGAVALTVASERVSFSRVIDSSSLLRRLDQLGRTNGPPLMGAP